MKNRAQVSSRVAADILKSISQRGPEPQIVILALLHVRLPLRPIGMKPKTGAACQPEADSAAEHPEAIDAIGNGDRDADAVLICKVLDSRICRDVERAHQRFHDRAA